MVQSQTGHSATIMLVALLVLAGIVTAGYVVWQRQYTYTATPSTNYASNSSSSTYSSSSGSSNADLGSNLSGVNSSLSKESSDQSGANGAINDQQNQVQVPTN